MAMKTYSFRVVVEPDEDAQGNRAWHAYCPALERQGAATSGGTEAEAIRNGDWPAPRVVGPCHKVRAAVSAGRARALSRSRMSISSSSPSLHSSSDSRHWAWQTHA